MNAIPTHELKHEDEHVFFAFRTMEENHKKAKGEKPLPHRHDFYTVLLVKNACGSHFIDYEEFKMKPRSIFFVAPGQVHQVVVTNEHPSGDILMFSEEFMSRNYISEEFISNLGMFSCGINTPPIELEEESFVKISNLSAEINCEFAGDSTFKFDSIASYLKLILIECNAYAVLPKDSNPQNIQSGRPLIKQFRHLLDKHVNSWHKVNEYAEAMNITPDYLNNVIKTNVGKTAKELIIQRIILEAKRLGLHTDLSTKEVAYQLGYDDPSHFSKFFKKETAQSFTDFKAQLEKMKVA
ncbi:MAG: AraC family transcriptional regulator [Prolixibacteraceae bacterium]